MFETALKKQQQEWFGQGIERGIERGIGQGIEQGELIEKQNVLIRLLSKKFMQKLDIIPPPHIEFPQTKGTM